MRSPKSSLADGRRRSGGVRARAGEDGTRGTFRNNSGEVPPCHPRGVCCGAGVLAAAMLAVGIVGCGGGDSQGATVSVYVGASLCKAAKGELAAHGASAGHFKIAARCLAPSEKAGGGVDLA